MFSSRILHNNGFSEAEVEEKRMVVYSNTIQSLFVMTEAMSDLGIRLQDENLEVVVDSRKQYCFRRMLNTYATSCNRGETQSPSVPIQSRLCSGYGQMEESKRAMTNETNITSTIVLNSRHD